MNNSFTQQTIALAAVAQSVYLVNEIATRGCCDNEAFDTCLESLFDFEGDTPEAIYGEPSNLRIGLNALADMFGSERSTQRQILLRYAMSALYLQSVLSKDDEKVALIRSRLEHAKKNAAFDDSSQKMASSIAGIYTDSVSQFHFRIQISGNSQYLQNPANADRIRALLMAAIRALFLWRQSGGRRFKLLFVRGKHRKNALNALRSIPLKSCDDTQLPERSDENNKQD